MCRDKRMKSCIYEGWVSHQRYTPVVHQFRYRLAMLYLDLSELDTVFRGRWLWSSKRPAVARFRRRDYLGSPESSLEQAVRQLVMEQAGQEPQGPIRLLTQPRYFGYGMNPVSFYYCFDAQDERVEWIVAEVTNTPWGESHCYLLDGDGRVDGRPDLEKAFHVSPFMPMDMQYRWKLSRPDGELSVAIENYREGEQVFDAALNLQRRAINGWNLSRVLLRFPFMTAQITGAIYFQALRLWWKGCPFHAHPRQTSETGLVSPQQCPVPADPESPNDSADVAPVETSSCIS